MFWIECVVLALPRFEFSSRRLSKMFLFSSWVALTRSFVEGLERFFDEEG